MKQAELTRERLLRAGLELFTAQGYRGTSTSDIARHAGVAEGALYRHFPGKQALLNEVYRSAATWAAERVREADAAAESLPHKLAHLAAALVRGAGREPAIVRLFFFQDHTTLLDEPARTAAREFRGGLEGLVAQGKADGLVRSGGVDALAAAWLGVVRVAMERIVTREWGTNSGGVTVCREAAWAAIAHSGGA
ncbi:MAG TPA: TetR/AcrR family transcriptional regulator [Gemmatimonadales bacterium]|nr:TetR/AcrR family transcriptional regulator [Gemmatimonadales bacterium]